MEKKIEIMDTTLRDGEQTSALFCCRKANYCAIVTGRNVDRIEIASACVKGISKSKGIMAWASTKDTKTASKF
jgi:D-citramalate synthase